MAHQDIKALFEAVPVIFYGMIVRVDAIRRCYPGGLAAFDKHHPDARRSQRLRSIGEMCFGEAGDRIKELEEVGLKVGTDIALAEMVYGEIEAAPGIQFIDISDGKLPRWVAIPSGHPAYEEVGR